jgi:DNA-binding transcriptional LysR family regulator
MKNMFDRIDLNLLKALHALLEERSVTRAADRLFITQSAMSKALQRLRELFDDALLVRCGAGLTATPLAENLLDPLRDIVVKVEACLALPTFDPALASGRIRIAVPEQFAFVTGPALLQRLRQQAPTILIESQHLMDRYRDLLATGQLDFVVTREEELGPDFSATQIYAARPMCWVRKGHPLAAKANVELADICALQIVSLSSQHASQNFSPKDVAEVRAEIERQSLRSNVIFDTSHVVIAIDALIRFDALMFAPDFLSRLPFVGTMIEPISISHIPVLNRLSSTLFLAQHKRTLQSPLHRWLVDAISESIAQKPETNAGPT